MKRRVVITIDTDANEQRLLALCQNIAEAICEPVAAACEQFLHRCHKEVAWEITGEKWVEPKANPRN